MLFRHGAELVKCAMVRWVPRNLVVLIGCLLVASFAAGMTGCSRRARTKQAMEPVVAQPVAPLPPQPPPTPPVLPGLRVDVFTEPVFGGQYSLLSVGPLRPRPTESTEHQAVPPLLLVHGLGQFGMADFYSVLEALAQDRRVIAVDLPGFGQSTRGNRAYRPAAFAKFLAHVVDTQAAGKVDVLGHSMGGAISIAFAGAFPTKVRRLTLVDAAGVLFRETLVYEMENEFTDEPEANLLKLVGRDLWKAALSLASPFSVDPDVVLDSELLRGKILKGDPMQISALALLEHNFDGELRAVAAPTLIVWGRQDTTAPLRTYHVLRERLPVWQSTLLDGVGHNPMLQAPDRLLARVIPFLDAHELGPLENRRPGVTPLQQGGCNAQPVRSFEGRWSRLEISGCRQVLIQNAVVESLLVKNSNVELRHVTVEQGTFVSEGSLRATGSLLLGDNALQINSANVDLAGVELVGTDKSLSVSGKSTLIASVTGVSTNVGRRVFHGRVKLGEGSEW